MVASGVPLQQVYEEFLTRLRIPNLTDNQAFTAVLIVLDAFLADQPQATCTVFQMSSGQVRERSVNSDGEIINLFQGEAPVHPRERRGEVYPGDRAIRGADRVTLQIHTLDLQEGSGAQARVVASDVPVVAVWIAPEVAEDVIVQDQGT